MTSEVDVVGDTGRVRGTFSPLRRRILEELAEPASATGLAERLGETRQRVNYHLRELEKGGLVELVEQRQRRGRIERFVRATAKAVVVAPEVIGKLDAVGEDRFAVDTLLAAAASTVNDVAAMREAAETAGKRLVTFTVEAEIGFGQPSDIERFATRLADRVAELVEEFDDPQSQRRYRLRLGAYPKRQVHDKETAT
ncbi:winged helix-turn-helix domain-containing protein [Stackebrandtia nassauensis]|uniref:Putative transcriptional regulator n=1 Tax=Stackebrandtia nassauensis (strain DSM 44728 / CIP 108903 / NRRL B-16338 / NBRC 102104 / LLR-40K-21) TaxID=446470 RepID=D3Q0Z6_STANL|nr:winged helix-turn-helix domain-containing protein [Stackebrandtia nassauensis]ADD43746.1 putative transcriptional regulator [Stackebrandtia nassauensis DSM 44728]